MLCKMIRRCLHHGLSFLLVLVTLVGVTLWDLSRTDDTLLPVAESRMTQSIVETTDGASILGLSQEQVVHRYTRIEESLEPVAKKVALTFDDGPHPIQTRALLQVLRQHNVPATFFPIGLRASQYTNLLEEIAADGHQIGNHTWDHRFYAQSSAEHITHQLVTSDDLFQQVLGRRTTVFRPPGGVLPRALDSVESHHVVLWSVDPQDWKHKDAAYIADHVIRTTLPGDVILLHDIYEASVESVPHIIRSLREKGYSFVTVDELFGFTPASTVEPGVLYHYADLRKNSNKNSAEM